MIRTNTWNRIRYSVYAPLYDRIATLFNDSRRRSIDLLNLQAGDRVLLLGAGTGIDLEFLPAGVDVTAIDVTPAMVKRIQTRAEQLQLPVKAHVMDGQALDLPDRSFEAVVLHLILSVIPDPSACVAEAVRVLKPGGHVAVFDKFLPDNTEATITRRLANKVSAFFFSEINRQLAPIVATVPLELTHQESAARFQRFGYTITVFQKSADPKQELPVSAVT